MEPNELEELRHRKKLQLIRLMEVSELTEQLLQAADRRDQVSMQMLLSMRQTPIQQLQEIEEGLRDYVLDLPEERAIRCNELLEGAEAEASEEFALAEQVAQYRRLLNSVRETDKRLSTRLGGKRSFYHTFRES